MHDNSDWCQCKHAIETHDYGKHCSRCECRFFHSFFDEDQSFLICWCGHEKGRHNSAPNKHYEAVCCSICPQYACFKYRPLSIVQANIVIKDYFSKFSKPSISKSSIWKKVKRFFNGI
jgi:hypothetical protein